MRLTRCFAALAVTLIVAACGSAPAPSATGAASVTPTEGTSQVVPTPGASAAPAIVLRAAPPDMGCDSIGWEGEPYRTLTFHIDATADPQVWAQANTGALLATSWSRGFAAGTPEERVVRDPAGNVFISDGEVVPVPEGANLRIHDYLVCLERDELTVLTNERG
jgi:hypothetical protein